jgi:hypothetical protein
MNHYLSIHYCIVSILMIINISVNPLIAASKKPINKVTIAILAKDKAHTLPLYLSCIENQTWPTKKTYLYIRTNNNNDNTAQILKNWVKKVRKQYAGIYFDDSNVAKDIQRYKPHEWNADRYEVLSTIRQESVEWARSKKTHYFVVDCDNFIQPHTLETLLNTNASIIAPMLCNKTSRTNFNAIVDENGCVRHTALDNMLLSQKIEALVPVSIIHSTYLLKHDILENVSYTHNNDQSDILTFSEHMRALGIPQYIDTRSIYGRITFADNEEQMRSEPWLMEFQSK